MSAAKRQAARVAVLSRHAGPDHAVTLDARRDLAEAKITEYVQRVVAQAPPLTADQRVRLAALLLGGDA